MIGNPVEPYTQQTARDAAALLRVNPTDADLYAEVMARLRATLGEFDASDIEALDVSSALDENDPEIVADFIDLAADDIDYRRSGTDRWQETRRANIQAKRRATIAAKKAARDAWKYKTFDVDKVSPDRRDKSDETKEGQDA